jgi:hypothetical protein
MKHNSETWCKIKGVEVLDPDGWDRSPENFAKSWAEEITEAEFDKREAVSTTRRSMARLICLVEFWMESPPFNIVAQEFGSEWIVDNETGKILASGTSVFLSGPSEDIRRWVSSVGSKLWTSNNPMAGNWKQISV